jgi:hypothetical protein
MQAAGAADPREDLKMLLSSVQLACQRKEEAKLARRRPPVDEARGVRTITPNTATL